VVAVGEETSGDAWNLSKGNISAVVVQPESRKNYTVTSFYDAQ